MNEVNSIELWDSLRSTSRNIEAKMNPLERKRTGSYYTDLDLTDVMMQELVDALDISQKKIIDFTFFEPCVGSGNFVFSYLKAVKPYVTSREEAVVLLNNIYAADINLDALEEYKKYLSSFALEYWKIELQPEYFETHIGSGLLIDVTTEELNYIRFQDIFSEKALENGFDIVVTNPPYINLKAERGNYSNENEYERDKKKYASISKMVNKTFKYSVHGVLNLYKLFVEEIIDKYANKNAYISLLLPSSILSDKTSMELRTHILCDTSLLSVKVIKEGSGYVDAQQALCTLFINKGKKSDTIRITKDFCKYPEEKIEIQLTDIINKNTSNAIMAVSEREYEVLKKLREFPVVKELDFIVNARGELDLTAGKKYITSEKTGYSLIRGRNIGFYKLIDTKEKDSVYNEFIEITKKRKYIESNRIICQQIANMNKERRITFAYISKGYVLGNSCNFIVVEKNKYEIDIYALLGLFNSSCINWFFKLTSSNNHINNYEIDNFPVPVDSDVLKEISIKVREYIDTNNDELIAKIEKLSMQAYGLL